MALEDILSLGLNEYIASPLAIRVLGNVMQDFWNTRRTLKVVSTTIVKGRIFPKLRLMLMGRFYLSSQFQASSSLSGHPADASNTTGWSTELMQYSYG